MVTILLNLMVMHLPYSMVTILPNLTVTFSENVRGPSSWRLTVMARKRP